MKKEELEKRLVDALIELLKTTNIADISAIQLIKKAEVSKSTFYRSYDSISDFIRYIEDKIIFKFGDLVKYSITSNLCMKPNDAQNLPISDVFEYIYEIKDLYLALTSPNGDPLFKHKGTKLLNKMYVSKIAYEDLKSDFPDVYVRFALAGHHEMLNYWLRERPDISPKDMAMIAQRLMYGLYSL